MENPTQPRNPKPSEIFSGYVHEKFLLRHDFALTYTTLFFLISNHAFVLFIRNLNQEFWWPSSDKV